MEKKKSIYWILAIALVIIIVLVIIFTRGCSKKPIEPPTPPVIADTIRTDTVPAIDSTEINKATTSSRKHTKPSKQAIQNTTTKAEQKFEIVAMENGEFKNCPFYTPKYDNSITNRLTVSIGGGYDVVVKLVDLKDNSVIRYVYVQEDNSFSMRGIPPGKYVLKLAYGKNWAVPEGECTCKGKFIAKVFYKQSQEILDFNVVKVPQGYSVPSFELDLSILTTNDSKTDDFKSKKISASDF